MADEPGPTGVYFMDSKKEIWDYNVRWVPQADLCLIRIIDHECGKFILFPIEYITSGIPCDIELLRNGLIESKIYRNKTDAIRAARRASSYFRYHEWDVHGWTMVQLRDQFLYFYDRNSHQYYDNK